MRCTWKRGRLAIQRWDQGRLVRAVVVQDEVDGQPDGHGGVDRVEELSELDGAMTPMELSDDLARLDIERREQRGRPVARVVVRPTLDLPRAHGQQWLRVVQRLNLRLLVDAQHDGMLGRIQVEPHNVADLRSGGVGRQLEGRRCRPNACQMRLIVMRLRPVAVAIPLRLQWVSPRGGSPGCGSPRVRRPRRRSPAAPPGGVQRTDRLAGRGQSGPATSRRFAPACAVSAHPGAGQPLATQQDDPRPPRQVRSRPGSGRQRFQALALRLRQHERSLRSPCTHALPPCRANAQGPPFVPLSSGTGHY